MLTSPSIKEMAQEIAQLPIPCCDHYCGTWKTMRKSLALQAQYREKMGFCPFDVTLDCEDGASIGRETAQAQDIAQLIAQAPVQGRLAVRLHPLGHPAWPQELDIVIRPWGQRLSHVMLPKIDHPDQVEQAAQALDAAGHPDLPLHVLVESAQGIHEVWGIAAHPRVASISFGLMDFVSSYGLAIPQEALCVEGPLGQFAHPLVIQAKLAIVNACHAHGKVPSHNVVTEFNQKEAIEFAAQQAVQRLGFTRMWSIHPSQIDPILAAFTPSQALIDKACALLEKARAANWGPIRYEDQLHDRASFRFYTQVLERSQFQSKQQNKKTASAQHAHALVSHPTKT
jgi:citrate lyase subunit beta/citryl-CoA lyase